MKSQTKWLTPAKTQTQLHRLTWKGFCPVYIEAGSIEEAIQKAITDKPPHIPAGTALFYGLAGGGDKGAVYIVPLTQPQTQEVGKATKIDGIQYRRKEGGGAFGQCAPDSTVEFWADGEIILTATAETIIQAVNSHSALIEVSRAAKAMRHYGRLGDSRGERAAGEQLDEALTTLNRNA